MKIKGLVSYKKKMAAIAVKRAALEATTDISDLTGGFGTAEYIIRSQVLLQRSLNREIGLRKLDILESKAKIALCQKQEPTARIGDVL